MLDKTLLDRNDPALRQTGGPVLDTDTYVVGLSGRFTGPVSGARLAPPGSSEGAVHPG